MEEQTIHFRVVRFRFMVHCTREKKRRTESTHSPVQFDLFPKQMFALQEWRRMKFNDIDKQMRGSKE